MPMRFWNEKSLERLSQTTCFSDIGDVALDVLGSIGEQVNQVCGPISSGGLGSMEENMAVFSRAIHVLHNRGYVLFNQVPLQDAMIRHHKEWRLENPEESYCWPILDDIYAPIFESGIVKCGWFIPGWETSTGTKWERQKLTELNIDIWDIPKEWLL